jgi:hormone-sensitive lipase
VSSFDKVIIHAHGGGFVALSSSTMQNYTRLWSKELDVPVLSIDYRKPPIYPFPDPVYDVLAVYKFISSLEIFKHTNLRPTTIILAGDSSGANLVLSAAALAMKIRLPQPKAFFLAYPASDLRSIYTPSRISSFTDAILHPSLLLLCLKEYLGTNQKQV